LATKNKAQSTHLSAGHRDLCQLITQWSLAFIPISLYNYLSTVHKQLTGVIYAKLYRHAHTNISNSGVCAPKYDTHVP